MKEFHYNFWVSRHKELDYSILIDENGNIIYVSKMWFIDNDVTIIDNGSYEHEQGEAKFESHVRGYLKRISEYRDLTELKKYINDEMLQKYFM